MASFNNAGTGDLLGDQFARAHGFSVEITGGQSADSNEGNWLTVSHSGIKFDLEDVTLGTDQIQTKAVARTHWGTIKLSGHLTKDRNAVKDMYKDMKDKGTAAEVYRTITITWKGPNGDPIHSVAFNDCFLLDFTISELNSNEENVPCIEYSTWQCGYSLDFLG